LIATALGCGYWVCHVCNAVQLPSIDERCARCQAGVHARKPASVSRSWAYLIAAYVLYLPANLLPVMKTSSLFGTQNDTIMSGIIFLWTSGSWPLAVIVFVASILVPLGKLGALTILLVSVQQRWREHALDRARLYRLIEFVGRWSMLDIYVVTILVALVQVQAFAAIDAGPGAIAFGAVVVLTMLATASFDPRLIWDPLQDD
jgi:paraquat-inducible protein A